MSIQAEPAVILIAVKLQKSETIPYACNQGHTAIILARKIKKDFRYLEYSCKYFWYCGTRFSLYTVLFLHPFARFYASLENTGLFWDWFEFALWVIWVCFEIDLSLFWGRGFKFVWDRFDRLFRLLVVCEHTQQIDLKRKKKLLHLQNLITVNALQICSSLTTRGRRMIW